MTRDPIKPAQAEYLSCTETAKLIRSTLKKAFPGQTFSVKSSVYSGGASIRVRYTGGPLLGDVEKVANVYSGADFDGSIDLKTYHSSWLHDDGTVTTAFDPGTEGSMGRFPARMGDPIPGKGARLVKFGADYIFVNRDETDEEYWAAVERFETETGYVLRHEVLTWRGVDTISRLPSIVAIVNSGKAPRDVLYDLATQWSRYCFDPSGEVPAVHPVEAAERAAHRPAEAVMGIPITGTFAQAVDAMVAAFLGMAMGVW